MVYIERRKLISYSTEVGEPEIEPFLWVPIRILTAPGLFLAFYSMHKQALEALWSFPLIHPRTPPYDLFYAQLPLPMVSLPNLIS